MAVSILAGRSIAARLVLSSFFWSSLVLVIAGLILTALYRQAAYRSFDDLLLVYANDLAADLVSSDAQKREVGSLGDPRFEIPLSGWYWQVGRVEATPRQLTSSRSLVGNSLPTLAPDATDRAFGETRKDTGDGPENRLVRLVERDIDLGEDGRYVVRVAGPADEIAGTVSRFVVALVITFFLLGLGLGLSTLLQVRFGLRPLKRLRQSVSAVRQGNAERINGAFPRDVAPLAEELNLLIDTNRDILERARTHVGNLAHALKTPLSVIVNEADDQGGDAPARIREQAMLMRDQVDYYLKRARTAALAGTLGISTEVAPVLEALTRTLEKIYRERGVAILTSCPSSLRFGGERQDLEEMVGNLADNACKWAAGKIEITVEPMADRGRPVIQIAVDDDGPGMPMEAMAGALKRGGRLDETKPGSGLGLSIVGDLAGLYRGELTLDRSRLGGLRAVLRVPADRSA